MDVSYLVELASPCLRTRNKQCSSMHAVRGGLRAASLMIFSVYKFVKLYAYQCSIVALCVH